ncbi:MAG: glycosyltransferase family 9 protein [Bacteroidales bacterium]|nr:glycosyltransferase family 9 protein [Bacteroidales bacterium]
MRKILVIQTASIGDVILATALLEKLHRFYPDAEIDFLIKKGMESLFEGHPFIHQLLLWDKRVKYSSLLKLLGEVRRKKYDLVINLQRFTLTGITTALSGAKSTIGFDKNPLSWAFSHKIQHEIARGIHETERNQRLIEELTDETPEKPRLYPIAMRDVRYAMRDIKTPNSKSHIPDPGSRIYYTISPASLWFTKQFPAERWAELIREMPEEATVYLLGSKADFELCERIREQGQWSGVEGQASVSQEFLSSHPVIQNLAGQLTLLQSAALMKRAKMNFTNDSAPMHLASAVNAPVTVIYCSTVPDFGFGPLSDNSAIVEVQEKLSCRPCGLHGKNTCPEIHFKCAMDIDLKNLTSRF